MRTAAPNLLLVSLLLLVGSLPLAGCKKKEEVEQVPPPPSPGGASADLVATEIGSGLGLRAGLASTSTKWLRAYPLGDTTVVLLGRSLKHAIALRSNDRGRTWVSFKAKAKRWASWGVSQGGALALVSGDRRKMKVAAGRAATIENGALWFAGQDTRELSGPRPFFPDDDKLKNVAISEGIAAPAILSNGQVSLLVDRGRSPLAAFSTPGGGSPPKPTSLSGSIVTVPYGRPPQMLSIGGGSIRVRPWPAPDEALGPASPIPGARSDGNSQLQLSQGPGCESGAWSFQRIVAGGQPYAVIVSGSRAFAFKLPQGKEQRIGCGPEAITVEISETPKKAKSPQPQLVRCDMAGKCAKPKSPPFAPWTEKHERSIWSAPTKDGLVAIMQARAGARWGMYLAQSRDLGATFELPRTVGEGKSDRGRLKLGALVRLPGRLLLLVSADITGTSKRGWFILASDDNGNHWGPP